MEEKSPILSKCKIITDIIENIYGGKNYPEEFHVLYMICSEYIKILRDLKNEESIIEKTRESIKKKEEEIKRLNRVLKEIENLIKEITEKNKSKITEFINEASEIQKLLKQTK
ncbi:MAG: hypothetical protein N2043_02005 [Ignavibacterium sp.]|nr:hypothetical protein [Ignavibacterium sp.]